MISRGFKFLLLAITLSAVAAAIVAVKLDNARLRKRLVGAQREQTAAIRLRDDNNRMRTLAAQAETDEQVASAAVHARILQSRDELAHLEKDAAATHARLMQKAAQDAAALENNRDLRNGLVRLEHLTDVGRATPEAALQTLVWAGFKGEDAKLASIIVLSDAVRQEADALLATLPEEARAAWTPQKLAALFFAGFLTEMSAATIQNVTIVDADHATVAVRFTTGSKEAVLPLSLQRGDAGWRVVLPEKAIGAIQRRLQAMAKDPTPK
jgi:hypothetical protein